MDPAEHRKRSARERRLNAGGSKLRATLTASLGMEPGPIIHDKSRADKNFRLAVEQKKRSLKKRRAGGARQAGQTSDGLFLVGFLGRPVRL